MSDILHIGLLVFLSLVIIGLGYSVRNGYLDWKAHRELTRYLDRVEQMRKWKN